MGYIFALILAGIVFGVLFVTFLGGAKRPSSGKVPPETADKTPTKPAADEPTPGASSTASGAQAEKARGHTPPA